MGRVVLQMSVSLDGYYAAPDGGLGWQTVDAELHGHFDDVLDGAAAFYDGRVTWELMAGYWPTADQDPDASPEVVRFAGIWRRTPKVLLSRTLTEVPGPGWRTVLRHEVDPDELRALAAGGDVFVGGGVVGHELARLDLVDEYRIYLHPVRLGAGRPLLTGTGRTDRLVLLETRTFGSGVVLLRYGRAGRAPEPGSVGEGQTTGL